MLSTLNRFFGGKPTFQIFFGRGGRTVDYEDKHGRFTFVFEVDLDAYDPDTFKLRDPAKKEVLILDSMPLRDGQIWSPHSPLEASRVATMLEKIREHLITLGYDMRNDEET
jgi:hypothetical protein